MSVQVLGDSAKDQGGRRKHLRRPRSLLSAPALLFYLIFYVAPVSVVAWYSLGQKPDLFQFHDNSRISLDRYVEALSGPFVDSLLLTLRIVVIGTASCAVIAMPVAYFIATKVSAKVKVILLVLILVPLWCNFLLRILGWRIALAPDGILMSALEALGLSKGQAGILDTHAAVQLGIIYVYLPLMIFAMFVSFERLSPSLREASRDLGAGRIATLLRVTLPLALPGIATGCLLTFVLLMGDMVTPSVLGGAAGGGLVSVFVANWFLEGGNWALGSAEAILLIATILLCAGVVLAIAFGVRFVARSLRRVEIVSERERSMRQTEPLGGDSRRLGGQGERVVHVLERVGLRLWTGLVLLFLFLPIGYVVVYSFNDGRLFAVWDGLGLDAYRGALSSSLILGSVRVSLLVAVGSALLATVLGSLVGLYLARYPGRWAGLLLVGLAIVFITPDIMVGIAELPWFVFLSLDQGLTIFNDGVVRLILTHAVYSTALVAFLVRARMISVGSSQEQAAADLYAPPLRQFFSVTLPVMAPAVLIGGLLAFSFSLDNVVASSFVSVQGTTPWPVYVYSTVRAGLRPEVAAMATILLLAVLMSLAVVALVARRLTGSSTVTVKMLGGRG